MCDLMDEAIDRKVQQNVNRGRQEGLIEGLEQGERKGLQQGMRALVDTCKKFGISFEETLKQLQEEFSLDASAARQSMAMYW